MSRRSRRHRIAAFRGTFAPQQTLHPVRDEEACADGLVDYR
ncbi:hypothetical protein [Streptomyces sp. NPDC059215]